MSNMNNGVKNLNYYRQLDGAILLDENDRFYRLSEAGERIYGYSTQFTGSYVCYTCGHLCECGDDSDDVETIYWSSSNPSGSAI